MLTWIARYVMWVMVVLERQRVLSEQRADRRLARRRRRDGRG